MTPYSNWYNQIPLMNLIEISFPLASVEKFFTVTFTFMIG
ncbi:hypothetical protein AVDCRST_MAG81-4557 [uncultured Synechococcales cyanobacterium]|uniref:Uncharacterized protein n=1 Tax=uncultured Synechococcales cyanobacterium TaxID=1936017 RepID=A0A6J4VVA6_9CYAN|nr:hypothetical protein AVDCRST_MAG81-4557 [uncultured Synechococcales cyanobacterium]